MKINDMFPSNYLKKEDVTIPQTVTIKGVTQEEVAGDGGKELKNVLHFHGNLKPMILNRGNAETIVAFYGDDSDNWVGKSIEVYSDPSVMFGGKRVGGVRVRQPAQRPNPVANPIAAGQTTQNGFGNAPLWDIHDGNKIIPKLTTAQVEAAIQELHDQNIPLNTHRVRSHPNGNPVGADVWQKQHGTGRQPSLNDPIPF